MRILFLLTLLFIGAMGCNVPLQTQQRTPLVIHKESPPVDIESLKKFYVDFDQDGNYEVNDDEEIPQPIQGAEQWGYEFYRTIQYPVSARRNSISGVVILNALVDEMGKVESVEIKQSVSLDCDNEAKRAFLMTITKGFQPYVKDGKSYKFKIDVPVSYRLD